MKKILAVTLTLALLLCCVPALASAEETTAAGSLEDVAAALDADYALSVTTAISELGDNPDVGNRSCGSEAESQAAEIILGEMEAIGLQNITVDEFTADTWSFNRGRVYYTDEAGEEQYLALGGFATSLTCDEDVQIVYAGYGTEADYEGLDVEGKVVLIDINQADDWWVDLPAYEAYTHGALCVLVCNVDGYATWDEDTIGSQDICGPDYAPAFAVSQNSAAILQQLIAADGGETTVHLDVDSVVEYDGTSQNLYGEIPGATDEVIYFFAHYDGYYHSFFDDAEGVGSVLAIAKAMVEAGYQPDKTIRFCFHGAEEWGHTDTEYDWSAGAYEEISTLHPDWAENAFAILNVDGMYPVEGHTTYTLAAVDELTQFISEIAPAIFEGTGYEVVTKAYTSCWTEDFGYVRAGVPSIIASHAEPSEIYHGTAYHSTMDNIVLGVDMDAWSLVLELFATLAVRLDELAVRPMEFTSHFEAMEELYAGASDLDFDSVYAAAGEVDALIDSINADYAAALAAGDDETAAALRAQGIALDSQLYEVYDYITDSFLSFDYDDNTIFPFEMNEWAIDALQASIECLENGDAAAAYDEYLYCIDFNWYAYDFSQQTYEYMLDKMNNKADGTWGEGMIRYPGENLWAVIHSIADKMDDPEADYTDEIAALQESLDRQLGYQAEIEADMASAFETVTAMFAAVTA